MGRVWPITLATACATLSLAIGGCGDSERTDPGAANGGAGGHTLAGEGAGHRGSSAGDAGSGEFAGAGTGASGGANDGSGDSSESGGSRPRGGSGGTRSGGGGTSAGGTGNATSSNAGDAGDSGLAGSGTGATKGVGQLDVCVRQTDSPSALAWDVSRAFEISVNLDCRIDWVRLLYLDPDRGLDERVEFLNQLLDFSLDVWGCYGSSEPRSFDLIWKPTPLSAADVALLIDDYVAAATKPLDLSPGEIVDLRAMLNELAAPLLLDPDPGGLSNPRCDGAGGAAGASGAGGQAGSG